METIRFDSANQQSKIYACIWMPDTPPAATVQLSHGMAEHIGRYAGFAEYLTGRGIAVCGADHVGHGRSAVSTEELGWFGDKNGAQTMCGDMHRLREIMQARHPELPHFILGHSMGSFVLRRYLVHSEFDPSGLAGAILSGTGDKPPLSRSGRLLARLLRATRGGRYPGHLLDKLAFSGYSKHIPDAGKGSFAWLSRDPEVIRAYEEDAACGFVFTAEAFADFGGLVCEVNAPRWYRAVPHGLPLLVFSGSADPVGQRGKGFRRVCERLRRAGAGPLRSILYEGGRHEMLLETNRHVVWRDVADWVLDTASMPR